MQEVKLVVTSRDAPKERPTAVRGQGLVPGVMYGQGKDAVAVKVDAAELAKAFQMAGTSKIIEVEVQGGPTKSVLFHDVQYDHMGKNIIHFDLYTVKMDEKIRTEVPIHFTGESPAVYEQNATLLKNLEEIEVEALPRDLPENIEVDISGLIEMEQSLHISDLKVPEGVTILAEPEEMIVKIEAPREEEEEEELPPEGTEADLVESEHGGNKDDDDGADDESKDDKSGDKSDATEKDSPKE